jgi:tyrosine-protein phosphatase SIW14
MMQPVVIIPPPRRGKRRFNAAGFGIALTAIAVILGLVWWNNGLRDRFFPKNFGVVEPGHLYRSGRLTPEMMRKVVRENSIKLVVDLGADPDGSERNELAEQTAEGLGVRRVRFNLLGDGTGDPNEYVQALRLMTDPANQPVLVQCGAGAQRTSVACALYEHITKDVVIEAALKKAEAHRFDPKKDQPAIEYLREWSDKIERAYREGGTIEKP